ncbi:MAG: hypothetical protein WD733_18185 [Bryobacterales bacterium]
MLELFFFGGLLALVIPMAVLGAAAYLFFSLASVVFKAAGAVVGTVVALVFGVFAVVGVVIFAILCIPFLMFA